MLSILAATALVFSLQAPSAPQGCIADLAKLVGGHWEGKLGTATVSHRYESLFNGKAIHDVGSVVVDGKTILSIDARYGWDATAKLTYYLDVHNHDTVYFGHIVKAGDTFRLHFVNLCKPGEEESSSFKFVDDDALDFEIGPGAKGAMHRVKD